MASPSKPSKPHLAAKRYLDPGAVAERLGVTKRSAREFLAAAHAQSKGAFKLNGRWRISVDDFECILDELRAKSHSVLLVEDNPQELQKLLEAMQHSCLPLRISVAVDGRAALVCIEAKLPDLVIIDLSVLGMSAHDILRAIQPLHISTFVYSGRSAATCVRKTLEVGAVDDILKGSKSKHGLDAVIRFIRAALA